MEIGWPQITVLISVLAIDITLAVDNALVLGTVAAKLPTAVRKKAILVGIIAAAFFRIVFAIFASKLMVVFGLTLIGGLLLLWVALKLWRELRAEKENVSGENGTVTNESAKPKVLHKAVLQILLADVSMSLDNTLAVAGAARNHFWIMVFGLFFSVCLMGFAANLLAALVKRYRWLSYVGLAIVLYVALNMIWEGTHKILAS
jgi:YjbE family integral membrane protein